MKLTFFWIFVLISLVLVPFWMERSSVNSYKNIIETLYRQSARWAVASDQDDNDIIRLLHANYASGYLWAIKDIVSTDEFKRITGEDFLSFEQKITAIQDKATQRVVSKCKAVLPTSEKQLLDAIYYRAPIRTINDIYENFILKYAINIK